ncbi:MAG TPA: tandem-95 repeat protein [Gammaproteobacteria bacterium]
MNDVEITVKLAWRYNWSPMPVAVALGSDQAGFSAVKQSDDVIYVNGDSSAADYALQTTIFHARDLDPDIQYLVYYSGSARIVLENNSEGDWKIQTRIYLKDGNLAPKIDLPIIFEVPQLQSDGTTLTDWTFDLGSTDPNADKLRYRLANQSELGCATTTCGYTNPAGLSINPNTGLLTWTDSGNMTSGLYSAGIVAEDVDENGHAKSKTHVDLILSLVPKAQTEFTIDASIPETRNVIVEKGTSFSFTIDGTAIDTQSLGDLQGALVETSADNYTFAPGNAGDAIDLDPGSYPITFEVRADDGSTGNNYLVLTFIVPDPNAPRIANLEADRVIYPGGDGVPVDADLDAIVSDANTSDFQGGFLKLNVTFTDGQYEVLGIQSQGDGSGQIRRTGNEVFYEGSRIGTVSATLDGVGTALRVDFTDPTSLAALQALVRSLTYEDTFTLRAEGDRALSLYVRDPQGLSVAHDFYVYVEPDAAAPTMGGPVQAANQITLVEGDAIALSNENISFADPDGDAITFTVTSVTNGRFARVSDTATPIANFTQEEIILGQIAFVHDGSETAPTYELSASDGESPAVAAPGTVNFTNVSDQAPSITNIPSASIAEGNAYAYTPSIEDSDEGEADPTFEITNKPAWASFDTNTGALTGTPNDGDDGAYTDITITVTDEGGATDSIVFDITVTAVNNAPALTATASDPEFSEGGTAVSLFSAASASTVEAGQTFTAFTITVSNVTDGALETLGVDTGTIALADGTTGNTPSFGYSVAVAGTTVTINFSGGMLSPADMQSLVDGLTYHNASMSLSLAGSSRTVTITSLTDDGGTANGGDDTATLSLASTVTVIDDVKPLMTDANISISGATGSGGAFVSGDIITATWNDTASGDSNADVIIDVTIDFSAFGGGTAVAATNSSDTWTATYTIDGSSTQGSNLNVAVTATDNADNSTTTADTSNATVDIAAPSGHSVSFDDALINGTEANSQSFTFSNAEVGASYSYTISSDGGGTNVTGTGTIDGASENFSGINVSGLSDGTLMLSVVLTDSAGNTAAAVTDTATLDTAGPVPGITGDTGPVNGAFVASIDFGEAVTGFVVSDVTAGNATLSGFTDNGDGSYGVTVTPADDGNVTLDIGAGVASDAAGNGTEAAVQFSIAFDGTAPAAPSAPDMAAADDHGASDTDNITYDTTPVLSGTAEAGATVTVSSDVDGAIGSATADGTGAWSLAAALTEGEHKITATATDSAGNTSVAGSALTATIDVTDPSPPASTPGNGATEVPYNLDAIELDFDETMHAGSVTTISIMSGTDVHETVAVASATFSSDGTVSVPLANELTPGVSYSVALDGQFADIAGNPSAWSGMSFTAYNAAPVAGDDSGSTAEDSSVAIDVLVNDSDPEGALLNAASVTVTVAPANGSTSVNTATGVVTYTPSANHNGTDSFTYSVEDEHGLSDTATVSIVIAAINDAPKAEGETASTNEDDDIVIDVAANDSDIDADDAVVPSSIVIVTAPTDGTAIVGAGKILYAPDADFNGTDELTYTIEDESGVTSAPATVVINVAGVNDAPVATADDDTTDEDTAVVIDVLANDSDVDGTLDAASVEVLDAPENGTTSVATDGSITYTPDADFNGDDAFTYVVRDNEDASAAAATVNVEVTAVNDAPRLNDDSATVTEELATEINVLGNDNDVDGSIAPATVEVVTAPTEGTASVDATTGKITYTPGEDFTGNDSLSYRVKDDLGAWSSPAVVALSVTNVNDIPVATADSGTTAEDTAVVIDVIANDVDVEGALIASSVAIVDAPDDGELTVNADGTITYTPDVNFNGTDSFTYTVEDDAEALSNVATVSVTITAVNDAPVISGTPATTATAGVPYQFAPVIADVDEDTLTVTATGLPAWASLDGTSGIVSGTPAADDVASYPNIIITVSDGTLDDALAAFSIDVLVDTDGDTIADVHDADDDGDGIDDADEGTGDADDDGIPDSLDTDSDGDGIDDVSEGAGDGDGDGIVDYLDTDSDGDGIDDATEGNVDTDGDGGADYIDTDSDDVGIDDAGEGDATTDTDGDGKPDYLDGDSDGDGIDDAVEGAGDSDGDGTADNLDTDSDNDGIDDATEGNGDSDLDGTPDYLDTSIDEDGDGIPDIVEGTTDSDGDGDADFTDGDSDNDGVPDALEIDGTGTDADDDGISDGFDVDETGGTDGNGDDIDDAMLPDTDNDGRADSVDPDQDGDGIADGTESGGDGFDSDNDGIDDRWDADTSGNTDADGDGIGDDASLADSDADGDPDARDPDSDNDGVSDAAESGASGIDADGDGIDDAFDVDYAGGPDANGDGVSDGAGARDSDGDGRPDYLDLDSDNDGVTDVIEAGGRDADEDGLLDDGGTVTSTPRDTDGDGVPDLRDADSDDDGVNDIAEGIYAPLDEDGDGRIDDHGDDIDGDGIADAIDSEPDQRGSRTDNDDDGVPVNHDQDDDGDGIPDSLEGENDTDGDGTVDRLDRDGDNDGIPDSTEAGIPPASGTDTDLDGIDDAHDANATGGADANGDGIDDRFADRDTDGDGISDRMDNDSDNDGLADAYESLLVEPSGADSDGDGVDDAIDVDVTGGADANGDGIDDATINLADTDDDGIEDYRDPDSDNDGVTDGEEDGDFNKDGINDRFQQDPGVETGLEGGGSVSWLVLAFLFAFGALRRVKVPASRTVVIALAGVIVAVHSSLANAAGVHADDVRVEPGTTSVIVPITLIGFDGASDVVAVVSVPEAGGVLSIDTAGLALELEYGYDTFEQAGAIGFHGALEDVSVALKERLTWHPPETVAATTLSMSASEYQPDYFYNPDNGHYYKAISANSAIAWTDARDAAAMEVLHGMRGYLATVGSEAENIFVAHFVDVENVWLAASDSTSVINDACDVNLESTEGDWRWVAGPEACEQFWQGEGDGTVSEDGYASWEEGEPNNFRGGEHFAATNYQGVLGEWNDFAGNTPFVQSYLVEFGGMPGDAGRLRTTSGVATLEVAEAVPVVVAPPVVEPVVVKEPAKIENDVCVPGMLFINGCWSAGVGIVSSTLEPDDARSGWKLVDNSDIGFKLAVEYRFFERWFLELAYADLGSAGLRNLNPAITGDKALDYKVPSLMAGYLLFDPASRFNVHLKAGYASLQNNFDAQASSDQLHDSQLALGAGVRWRVLPQTLPDLRLQLELDYYDKDAVALGIMVMHAF